VGRELGVVVGKIEGLVVGKKLDDPELTFTTTPGTSSHERGCWSHVWVRQAIPQQDPLLTWVPSLSLLRTHKTRPKYTFIPVLSITAEYKLSSLVLRVVLPVRVKVGKSTFAGVPGTVAALKGGAAHTRAPGRRSTIPPQVPLLTRDQPLPLLYMHTQDSTEVRVLPSTADHCRVQVVFSSAQGGTAGASEDAWPSLPLLPYQEK